MAWSWTRLQENIQDGRVERQVHEYGCGAACIIKSQGSAGGYLLDPEASDETILQILWERVPERVIARIHRFRVMRPEKAACWLDCVGCASGDAVQSRRNGRMVEGVSPSCTRAQTLLLLLHRRAVE